MKILILTDQYPPYRIGGSEVNCSLVTKELIHRGHSVFVLTSNYGIGKTEIDGNIFRVLKGYHESNLNKILRHIIFIKQFFGVIQNYSTTKNVVRKFNPDLAFIWIFEEVTLLPVLAIQDLKIPTLFTVRSHSIIRMKEKSIRTKNWIKNFYHNALIGFRKFSAMQMKYLFFVGDNLAKDCENAGISDPSFRVIKNGLPDEWILKKPTLNRSRGDCVRLLYVGRFHQRKGTDIAIKTIEILLKEFGLNDLSLDLFGTGDIKYVNKLKEYVISNNLSKYISFHGLLDREKLIYEYDHYDFLIFPTPKYEGFGNVIIEAMARGLFVIASRIGGPQDIITHGKDGILVYPIEPVQFARAIYQYLSNPAEINIFRENAIKKISENFRFSKMMDAYEKFMLEVIK